MKLRRLAASVAKFASGSKSSNTATSSSTSKSQKSQKPPNRPSAAPRTGQLQISYEPALDGDADPGEVVWAWIPYEDDPSQGKDRPCLVIGRIDDRLAVIALTSKASGPERDRFSVGTGEWDRERRPSFAKIDRVIAVVPGSVRREGSIFPRDRFDSVVKATAARRPDIQVA